MFNVILFPTPMILFTCILLLETCLFTLSYNAEPAHNPTLHCTYNYISLPCSNHKCLVSDSLILKNLLSSCVTVVVIDK